MMKGGTDFRLMEGDGAFENFQSPTVMINDNLSPKPVKQNFIRRNQLVCKFVLCFVLVTIYPPLHLQLWWRWHTCCKSTQTCGTQQCLPLTHSSLPYCMFQLQLHSLMLGLNTNSSCIEEQMKGRTRNEEQKIQKKGRREEGEYRLKRM